MQKPLNIFFPAHSNGSCLCNHTSLSEPDAVLLQYELVSVVVSRASFIPSDDTQLVIYEMFVRTVK